MGAVMKFARLAGGMAALCALAGAAVLYAGVPARGFDVQGSAVTVARPGADITDTYFFPSPTNSNNVVAVMNVHPLIPAGQGTSTFFDQQVLYAMKFDSQYGNRATTGRPVENIVIQFSFTAPGNGTQEIFVYGPAVPATTGSTTQLVNSGFATGTGFINRPFTISLNGTPIEVFAGGRADSQFFNASQFWQIFPDRNQGSTAASCMSSSCSTGFTSAGGDYFANSNVLTIAVEMPKILLEGQGNGVVAYWATTSTQSGK
jgi:hypothetical protein